MKTIEQCPSCSSIKLVPFSFTLEAERNGDMHYAQTRCRECDLVFSNPMADQGELERFYRASYYQNCERAYNAHAPNLEQIIRQRAREEVAGLRHSVLPHVGGGAFFEIGCGHGALLEAARQLGFAVAGIEPSEQAASFARDVLGLADVKQGLFNASEWPAESFDVIYSFQVIEHVVDLDGFVGGIARMLKPGGLTVIGTENHHNAWVAVRRARSWIKGRGLPEFQTATHHTYYFSNTSLRRLVERHGLAVQRSLVYTPRLAEKLPNYRFRHWYSRAAFYVLHVADTLPGRGGRLLVWSRKRANRA